MDGRPRKCFLPPESFHFPLKRYTHGDKSGIYQDKNCRLTNLAQDICKFIATYDEMASKLPHSKEDKG
jgi:hypothetical protein